MNEKVRDLISIIRDHSARLQRTHDSVHAALDDEIKQLGKTPTSALIIAGLIENYYTCLETIFVRISQYFGNHLDPERWHSDLLKKMTIEIDGVRTAAVSRDCFSGLFQFLKHI